MKGLKTSGSPVKQAKHIKTTKSKDRYIIVFRALTLESLIVRRVVKVAEFLVEEKRSGRKIGA